VGASWGARLGTPVALRGSVLRKFTCLALFAGCLLAPLRSRAQPVLLAIDDAKQLSELQLAKVMADDSSLWLSVRLQGRSRVALVAAATAVETAPAAHAFLRALDFATRMRVAAPPGPLSGCGSQKQFELADSGLPEPRRVAALEVLSASSELSLRRVLADAGLPVEIDRVARFAADAQPPFQVLIYDVSADGGSTDALRLFERGHPEELPRIDLSGASTVSLSLIALASQGVLPHVQASADPSEFPVAYRARDAHSDYLSARGGWLDENPTRWLNEVQSSSALFAWTTLPVGERIAPVVSRYFEGLSSMPKGACEARVSAAHERASVNAADFACDGADDLSSSLSEVGFADLRLSRFFGMLGPERARFRLASSVSRAPLLQATDFDDSGCPPISEPPITSSEPPDSWPPPANAPPVVVGGSDDPHYGPGPVRYGDGSSKGTVLITSSSESCSGDTSTNDAQHDSCSGDTSSSKSSSDSCSGDTSASDSSDDSCSGDTSASDSSDDSCSGDTSASDSSDDSCSGDSSSDDGPDSCSGDSSDSSSDGCSGASDSSSDSGGCSKSEYDGDTCSGSSSDANANSARGKSAGLGSGKSSARPRPRQVRLSLLTLLAAALALPLRRLRASR